MEQQKGSRKFSDNAISFLDQCIKKSLRLRRAWDILFRIVPPNTADSPYSVILEKGAISEQFFVNQREVARCVTTANDASLNTDLRLAIHRLEKRANQKNRQS